MFRGERTTTKGGGGDLHPGTRPLHKLDGLVAEGRHGLESSRTHGPQPAVSRGGRAEVYLNFMLQECHCQKHTMPSAPVEARYRRVPRTPGQNYTGPQEC